MDTQATEDLLAENEEALKPVDKAIEGLVHMDEQQDLQEVTEQAVQELHARYVHRRALHMALEDSAIVTRDAIEALLADGYPEEPSPEVNRDIVEDIDQNRETIEYARSRFRVRPLTTAGSFEAGPQHAPSD